VAKSTGNFVDTISQEILYKALLNSLSSCSPNLKKHVAKRNILSCNQLLLGVSDLHKLVVASIASLSTL